MINLEEVLSIHAILIERFGGTTGVRDQGALEAAIHRPFATFDHQDLYPTVTDKAAALFESIIINHPFLDGNKRTAYVLMRLLLMNNGNDIDATEDDKYSMVISASKGEFRFEDIRSWIQVRLRNI
jgi:death-on-curing protein